jgi:hypothetical protein
VFEFAGGGVRLDKASAATRGVDAGTIRPPSPVTLTKTASAAGDGSAGFSKNDAMSGSRSHDRIAFRPALRYRLKFLLRAGVVIGLTILFGRFD